MTEKESGSPETPVLEVSKFLGIGWVPVSVKTHRLKKGPNLLKQTITLSYVKRKRTDEGEEDLSGKSNLQIKVMMNSSEKNEDKKAE